MPNLRLIKFAGIVAALALLSACFIPWIIIESRHITVTGIDSTGTNYGKPGYFHILMVAAFLICSLVQKIGAKRLNLLVVALNIGWAIRNFLILSACSGGECPTRKAGLWLMIACSVIMFIAALFPDMKIPQKKS